MRQFEMQANGRIPAYSLPTRNRRILLTSRPEGIPQDADFTLDEVSLGPIEDGQFRIRNIFLSVDPAQRGWAAATANYAAPVALGSPMRALAVGVITESRNAAYPVSSYCYGWFGWQDYAVASSQHVLTHFMQPVLPLSAHAGVLGISGLTAFLALNKLGRPEAGQTLLVSTAAGAVGSIVGQLAHAAGMRTIGLTGSDAKVARLAGRYGYDVGVNYRASSWPDQLDAAAPEGFDIYFDNVGGPILDQAIRRMRQGGRIVQCGTASISTWSPPPMGLRNEREILTRRLTWKGFIVFDYAAEYAAAVDQLAAAALRGNLAYDEDIENGIENAPSSIARLYAGENEGKKLIFIG